MQPVYRWRSEPNPPAVVLLDAAGTEVFRGTPTDDVIAAFRRLEATIGLHQLATQDGLLEGFLERRWTLQVRHGLPPAPPLQPAAARAAQE